MTQGRARNDLMRWLSVGLLVACLPTRTHAQETPLAPAPEAPLAPEPQLLAPPAEPLAPAPEVPPPPVVAAPVPVQVPAPAPVQEVRRPTARDFVIAYNTGLRFSIAPGFFLPSHGGNIGFSIAGDVRFGFSLGPVILAPGARVALFFPSGWVATTALATGRITIPLGPLAPFVMGGAGPGYVSEPSQAGLAWLGGGGLMVHFSSAFALGAEATYQGITDTRFRALFVGPSLLIGF